MAGYVEVSPSDVTKLSRFLGISARAFEAKHIVHVTRAGRKRIKAGYETCQFLGSDRRCTVYPARPADCRGYFCWEQNDPTVYEYARFVQHLFAACALRKQQRSKRHRLKPNPPPVY